MMINMTPLGPPPFPKTLAATIDHKNDEYTEKLKMGRVPRFVCHCQESVCHGVCNVR